MTTISLDSSAPSALDVDAIVIGTLPGSSDDPTAPPRLAAGGQDVDRAFDGRLGDALRSMGATGKAGEVVKLPTLGAVPARLVVAAGLGEEADADALRRAAGAAVRAL
ncbi:M17 family peptidase N-terminal domain-containing protein, partial [Thermomonospora catenispora]|uniref:M17 family peptidase N-terminal domain-containing protein n=1 Tax=Thermomonospora catenispora TaxID=2493090 RepID=UPI00240E47F4